jgi:hypothetical protein
VSKDEWIEMKGRVRGGRFKRALLRRRKKE